MGRLLILALIFVFCFAYGNFARAARDGAEVPQGRLEAGGGMMKPVIAPEAAENLALPPGIERLGENKHEDQGLHKGWQIGKHNGWEKQENKGIEKDEEKEGQDILGNNGIAGKKDNEKDGKQRTGWQITGQAGENKLGEAKSKGPIASD